MRGCRRAGRRATPDRVGRLALIGDGTGVLGEVLGGHRLAGLGGTGENGFRGGAGGGPTLAELIKQGHCLGSLS